MSPAYPCREPRCPALLPRPGRCPTHARAYEARRGTAAQRGYGHPHQVWRAQVLAEERICRDPDQRHPDDPVEATVADHIVPLRAWERDHQAAAARLAAHLGLDQDLADFMAMAGQLTAWSLLNGQGLCVPCHNAKTAREGHGS